MRIIAGEAGGRRLKSIKTDRVRPTLDRVKEALFNIINFKIYGSTVLDLFAGFGSLGLEAVSRGAKHVDFVEKDKKFTGIIINNINICRFNNRTRVFTTDVFTFLTKNSTHKYDIIFMDPPYGRNYINRVMELIIEKNILTDEGLIIAEHHKNDITNNFKQFSTIRDRSYGNTVIKVYKKREEK